MSSPKLVSEFLNDDEFLSRTPSTHNHNDKGVKVYPSDGGNRVLESETLTLELGLDPAEGKRSQARKLWKYLVQRSTGIDEGSDNKMCNINIHSQSTTSADTTATKGKERSLSFIGIDPKVVKALSSIRILTNGDQDSQMWLSSNGGKLDNLPLDLLDTIERCAPQSFHARVADFNDNLFYDMQQQYGLSNILFGDQLQTTPNLVSSPQTQPPSQQQVQYESNDINTDPDQILQSVVETNKYLGSFLATEMTVPQPPHVDFTWEQLERDGDNLRLGFFPLTQEGMFLQIWSRDDDLEQRHIQGEVIFIPFGQILTLPATTIHGGGFRTTGINSDGEMHGNLRFHLYLAYNDVGLSKNQTTNKYTEPNDKRKELTDRYVDTPMMKDLMEYLFVE
eukprot:CAMPEP_0203671548 /NCGR_PEP_ID=MMETSP0090-20130426/7295_1 /ASSEMBLY_ACC=CAM_ASM_001088 /TAXON_ID=426623 /ORGANISM="Chaetoceros affinis, Strain CCMP159" /LENGTH=392 /DNA_ID=CAMNT_0050536633 /DNA_START=12 /DNA_END=1190 /DNA_ORIENTATION=+